LLASLLRWQLGDHYELQEEVPVGKKPLQIDILLLHKGQGELADRARQILAGLVERLNDYTLLELKSPSDTLRAGDFQTLLAYALLYRAQNQPNLDPRRLTLIVLAPSLSRPYAAELLLLGVTAREEGNGVWLLEGGMLGDHPAWVLETEPLAGVDHPVLTVFSPSLLHRRLLTYEQLSQAGYTELVVYMAQQISQFHSRGKEFAMQHFGSEDEMYQVLSDVLATLPLQTRLVGLSPEQLLQAVPPEERVKGLSPEDRLKGLTPAELEHLKELLRRQTKTDDNSDPV
jgi:hypothetical protein